MKILTIIIDNWLHQELTDYLLSLNGVLKVQIYEENDFEIITITYDSNFISAIMLKLEIFAFCDLDRIPSLISFDKHSSNKLKKYEMIIKDLCCEYCLKGMIDDLFMIDGIESADSNFEVNYHERENVMISLSYDDRLISEDEIKKIELAFNS